MKKTLIILLPLILIISTFMLVNIAFNANAQEISKGLISTSTSTSDISSDATIVAAKFIQKINLLNKVKLSDALFTSPAFTSLTDFSTPIPDEEAGRVNPFAPF